MKEMYQKVIVCTIVVAQLLSLFTMVGFADLGEQQESVSDTSTQSVKVHTNNTIYIEEEVTEPKHELKPILNPKKNVITGEILVGFDSAGIVDYYYAADGVTVKEINENVMQFNIVAVNEFGSVDVFADYGNGEWIKSSVYTYKKDDMVYVSTISKDQAWYDCMKDQYDSGEITLEEWEEAYSELSKTFMVTEVIEVNTSPTMTTETMDAAPLTTNTSTTTTIQGLIEWECDANGTRLPLRIARVELRDRDAVGSQCIAEQYTDTNGEFALLLKNGKNWKTEERMFLSDVIWIAKPLKLDEAGNPT